MCRAPSRAPHFDAVDGEEDKRAVGRLHPCCPPVLSRSSSSDARARLCPCRPLPAHATPRDTQRASVHRSRATMVAVVAAVCAACVALVVSGIFLGLRFPGRARELILHLTGILQGAPAAWPWRRTEKKKEREREEGRGRGRRCPVTFGRARGACSAARSSGRSAEKGHIIPL